MAPVDSKRKKMLMQKHSEVGSLKKENVIELAALNSELEVGNII
jgi:hypothetical protein